MMNKKDHLQIKMQKQECLIDKIGKEVVERTEFKLRLVRVKLGSEGLPKSQNDFLQWQRHLRYKLDEYLSEFYLGRVISVETPLGTNLTCKENELHKLEYDISATYFVLVEPEKPKS